MTRHILAMLIGFAGVSCAETGGPLASESRSPRADLSEATSLTESDWLGVYASASEISGFSGTVLVLDKGLHDGISYRMKFYSDVSSASAIEQDQLRGSCLTDRNKLYLPTAHGYFDDGKPVLGASIDRYTLVKLNGHWCLMRDDAHRALHTENKLYDYGVLIKVSDAARWDLDLQKVEHPSIKMLYRDPNKPWNDPFVNGPNER